MGEYFRCAITLLCSRMVQSEQVGPWESFPRHQPAPGVLCPQIRRANIKGPFGSTVGIFFAFTLAWAHVPLQLGQGPQSVATKTLPSAYQLQSPLLMCNLGPAKPCCLASGRGSKKPPALTFFQWVSG